ncbi:MAG: DUF21 domain-containing protein, partial [Candidatus Sericytochromatia bacterium]|nr:DUF21 domain-containing protein [Candidatus Tanganyikabacteria bacterium]
MPIVGRDDQRNSGQDAQDGGRPAGGAPVKPETVAFNLALVLFFTLLNGFFVAAEFAMVKIRPTRLQELAEAGRPQARVAQHITSHLDAYLS